MKSIFLFVFVFVLILFMVIPTFLNTAMGQPPPPPPQDIPLDGGISLLLVAGVAYGVKRIHSSEKNKDNQ